MEDSVWPQRHAGGPPEKPRGCKGAGHEQIVDPKHAPKDSAHSHRIGKGAGRAEQAEEGWSEEAQKDQRVGDICAPLILPRSNLTLTLLSASLRFPVRVQHFGAHDTSSQQIAKLEEKMTKHKLIDQDAYFHQVRLKAARACILMLKGGTCGCCLGVGLYAYLFLVGQACVIPESTCSCMLCVDRKCYC
jgi:hypothetical protein